MFASDFNDQGLKRFFSKYFDIPDSEELELNPIFRYKGEIEEFADKCITTDKYARFEQQPWEMIDGIKVNKYKSLRDIHKDDPSIYLTHCSLEFEDELVWGLFWVRY